VDVGNKFVAINKGSFYELGQDGIEVPILGDLGNKMVDHLWNNFDSDMSFEVKVGDVIYLKVTFEEDLDELAKGCIANIQRVELKKDKNAAANAAANEKVWVIARILSQEQIPDTDTIVTEIEQVWKSDISDIFLGEKGGSCEFDTTVSLNVMVGLECEESTTLDPAIFFGCCIYLTPLFREIRFCGEMDDVVRGNTIVCCCDGITKESNSSSSATPSSSSSSSSMAPVPLVTLLSGEPVVTMTGDPITLI
jgi:hypothetical protein